VNIPPKRGANPLSAVIGRKIGRRLAELHLALAGNSELVDFAPEPIRPKDVQLWIRMRRPRRAVFEL